MNAGRRATKRTKKAPKAIPPEVLAVPQGTRERVRAEVQRRRKAGESPGNRAVREACAPASAGHVALLLRLVASGELDPARPWVVHGKQATPKATPKAARQRRAPVVDDDGEDEPGIDLEGLADEVLAARTHDELQGLAQRVAAEVARGRIEPRAANALTGLLGEARQNQAQSVKAQPDEPDPERVLLAAPEAYELLDDFEGIVSKPRRDALRAHVKAEAARDRLENPNRCNRDEP